MLDEMKTSKSSTIGGKLSKYLIVKPIILSKYKLGLGSKKPSFKWTDKLAVEVHKSIIKNSLLEELRFLDLMKYGMLI